jgi:hypothetical protein
VVTTKYLAKFQGPRAITRPKIIGPERNVNLICNSSLFYIIKIGLVEYVIHSCVDDFQLLILLFRNVSILWYFVFMLGLTYSIPVNPPPFRGSLPRKSLISRMDWVSCAGDINLPHTPFPPARYPPTKKSSTINKRYANLILLYRFRLIYIL